MNPAVATLILALAAPDPDPRQILVQLQLEDRYQEALQLTREQIREHPDRARDLGLHYLCGHLLDHLGRHEQAADAFAQAMGLDRRLALHSRYRAALEHEQMGHPETAAGLVATVVNSEAPRGLLEDAVRLFARTLAAGGECRLLSGIEPQRLPREENRYIRMAAGTCALRDGSREARRAAQRIFLELLGEDTQDEPQREAAESLARLIPAKAADLDPRDPQLSEAALIGMAFFQHRDFENAFRYLSRAATIFGDSLSDREYELGYAQVRSLFWQERFDEAAQGFHWLAMKSPDDQRKAQAFYQRARSLELAGRWRQAVTSFQGAFRAEPDGPWADGALVSLLRILAVTQQEDEAEMLLDRLRSVRSWREGAARAALFLAASDLVRGRADRAGAWLDTAARDPEAKLEVSYWRGRLAELEGRSDDAVDAYLEVLRQDLFHPLAEGARHRLEQPHLAAVARPRGLAAARSSSDDRLYEAWLLLGSDQPAGQAAFEHLRRDLAADRTTAPFLELQPLPVQRWPLWESNLRKPEEMLLALGDLQQAAHLVSDQFPLNDLQLAFTGSNLLAIAGQTHDSIRLAEILAQRIPDRLPEPLLPATFRRLLHPLAERELLVRAGHLYGVEPLLLAAVIREESRFDPHALSAASARGLTQFVQPTAHRIAARIGLGEIAPQDAYSPRVSVTLGAAYLQELSDVFRGAPEMAVAAYNAGEPQARLWRSYCFSSEPEEYFTKVGFRETRDYLARVLGSYARYRDLYLPHEPAPQQAAAAP